MSPIFNQLSQDELMTIVAHRRVTNGGRYSYVSLPDCLSAGVSEDAVRIAFEGGLFGMLLGDETYSEFESTVERMTRELNRQVA